MSPMVFEARAGFVAAALAAALAAASPAAAVVGASEAPSPLAGSALMVLRAGGGMCTAVAVAPDVVLTAAHCVGGGPGAVRLHWKEGSGEPILLEPAAIRRHPGFVADAVASRRRSVDLALVRAPAPFPARFVPAALGAAAPAKGAPLTLGGYGVAREGDPRSTGTFRTAALAAVEPYGPSKLILWASGRPGSGACEGDSGGPIADADGAVVAITSWAAGAGGRRGGCGGVSQGVLVGAERAWIDGTLREWGREVTWR